MLTIWGRGDSLNAKKAIWCAEELGIPYTQINAGRAFGLVDEAEYRAMNPNGRVPCIKDGDFVLWESNTIVRYLAAKYGSGSLSPTDLAQRASAEKWMDWATASLAAPFRDIFANVVRLPAEQRNTVQIQSGIESCAQLLAIVDTELAKQPFLSGQNLGIGDIPLGCFAYPWFEMPIERPELPHLAQWYKRLTTRPAYQKAVMVPLA